MAGRRGRDAGNGDRGWAAPLPVRRVERSPYAALPPDEWPLTVPAVAQVLREGLDLGRATVLAGENGSGKSTLLEAVAMAYGLSPEGGSTGARHSTRPSESALHEDLRLVRGAGASRWGYFLRAETMHGLFSYLEANPAGTRDTPASGPVEPTFHQLSHGESFLAMLNTRRFAGDGFFVLDEPEAGLSFTAQLALVGALAEALAEPGRQVLLATHSPVVASLPGARILQLDDTGLHEVAWEDLDVVDHYRRFLDAPERYLRHLH
ncbi:AAA family ATPase [Pedococcus sp. NPDC057267]|uniref:AAA family ATPase n=1 Tax=Pedococcus sp. NPDC057267 TaxID=3346077 RepID=UPI003632AD70